MNRHERDSGIAGIAGIAGERTGKHPRARWIVDEKCLRSGLVGSGWGRGEFTRLACSQKYICSLYPGIVSHPPPATIQEAVSSHNYPLPNRAETNLKSKFLYSSLRVCEDILESTRIWQFTKVSTQPLRLQCWNPPQKNQSPPKI